MARFLLVPGRGIPKPEHWMRRWADAHPEYVWAPYPPGPPLRPGWRRQQQDTRAAAQRVA